MSSPFNSLKAAALQLALKGLINRQIEKFGAVTDLALDPGQKSLRVELDLKGEVTRIWISLSAYELSEKDGALFIAFQNATASREWIAAALNQYVVGRAFRLPNAARVLL